MATRGLLPRFGLRSMTMQTGKKDRATTTINWVREHMLATGVLSEQFNPFNSAFISVAPLTWSQAEFVTTILDLSKNSNEQT